MFLNSSSASKYLSHLWLYIIYGFLFGLISPPYDQTQHVLLTVVPLLTIPLFAPFFYASLNFTGAKKFWALWLWGSSATFSRTMWLINVNIEGKWLYIILALCLLSLFLGIWYVASGYLLSWSRKFLGKFWFLLYPGLWVILDYSKSLGELSFPWLFQGYLFTPFLSLSQIGAVTGIWGLTWLAIFASILFYLRFVEASSKRYFEYGLAVLVVLVSLAGYMRIEQSEVSDKFRVALIQSNLDHKNWDKKSSLDKAMKISKDLIASVKEDSVDLIVLPESGVYTYLDHNGRRKAEVRQWAKESGVPIALGTLDYIRREKPDSGYKVYNTAFLQRPGKYQFEKYYKMKLVPVSEGMPYGWKFPILSRIKIPGGSFQRGFENVVWDFDSTFSIAPTICYESIYPDFIRSRVGTDVDAMVNVTNDSWFGDSPGPYQHAVMARFRAIETGVPVVRCAASGISLVTDGVGRIVKKTKLGERTAAVVDVPARLKSTIYLRFGDWFVWLNMIAVLAVFVVNRVKRGAE